jgi:carboxymethylenebutenolidase
MTQTTRIRLDIPSGPAEAVLARPSAHKVGVIVLQEWWGIVPHIEDIVRRFAAHGYVAMAPDLYHGKSTLDAEEASHLMKGLDWPRAATEITAAVKHLREVEGCAKVGVVGYCMGGALAMIAAAVAGVDAYAAYYGFPPSGAADLSSVRAPGLLFFGEHEGFFSVPDAQRFAEAQRAKGVSTDVIVYPGAGHAFFNDTRPEAYERNAANDAWRKTLAHFAEHLRG